MKTKQLINLSILFFSVVIIFLTYKLTNLENFADRFFTQNSLNEFINNSENNKYIFVKNNNECEKTEIALGKIMDLDFTNTKQSLEYFTKSFIKYNPVAIVVDSSTTIVMKGLSKEPVYSYFFKDKTTCENFKKTKKI